MYIEHTSDRAWDRFLAQTEGGSRGLCVTRVFPEWLRYRVGPRKVTILWLSNVRSHNSVQPTDLTTLEGTVRNALTETQVSAVLFEGLEYLIKVNAFEPTARLLHSLHSEASRREAEVMVPLDPNLIPADDVEKLRHEFPEAKRTS